MFDEEIEIKLILTENLNDSNAKQLEIQRNFLQRKKAVRKINGKTVLDKDFEDESEKNIMPDKDAEKPSFRQIISHNIRYKDDSINNTLTTLDKFTSDVEYETLYLYLLGTYEYFLAQNGKILIPGHSFDKGLHFKASRTVAPPSTA